MAAYLQWQIEWKTVTMLSKPVITDHQDVWNSKSGQRAFYNQDLRLEHRLAFLLTHSQALRVSLAVERV
jgi:hypothetical protein